LATPQLWRWCGGMGILEKTCQCLVASILYYYYGAQRCIVPYNLIQDIFIQSKVNAIFPKCKMAAAAILDFQFVCIWPFWRVGSVVFVFCTKFGSNICYSHWDRRTYASNLYLMTSRELTSGFDFWSRGHLCMAVMHLPMKFGADIFIQSGVIDVFRKLKMVAAAILYLFGWAVGPPTKPHSWRVPPVKKGFEFFLVQALKSYSRP